MSGKCANTKFPALMVKRKRLYFVEPSKVDKYHITLIDGYLDALTSSKALSEHFDIVAWLSKSTYANLSAPVRAAIQYRPIPVIHQDKHHVVRKSLLEFFVMARCLVALRSGDAALVSCLMPTALLLLEWLNVLLRKDRVFVVIHGEIDGLIEGRREHWRSIGHWATRWASWRGKHSRIAIVVIDDFIKDALLKWGWADSSRLHVVHHPITAVPGIPPAEARDLSICFVGFRTKSKGYSDFEAASLRHLDIRFVAIGQGRVERVGGGDARILQGSAGFLAAIANCAAALFPYTDGYGATLSAAALDTLSAGVHIIATPRPFFLALAEYFGTDFITIYRTAADLDGFIADPTWLAERRDGQMRRRAALEASKYGIDSVRHELETLLLVEPAGIKT